MNKNAPVNARIRLATARWPDDAPRGTVSTFRAEHDIGCKTFHAIRARARNEGQAAALKPRSRRPKTSPTRLTAEREHEALKVRAALESSGLEHGPISVHDKMLVPGMQAPAPASLARSFREKNVARNASVSGSTLRSTGIGHMNQPTRRWCRTACEHLQRAPVSTQTLATRRAVRLILTTINP